MVLMLAEKFKASYSLSERHRIKKPAGELELRCEQELAKLRKEEAVLKATAPKSERLLEVWNLIRSTSEMLQDERERLQGKWLRGQSLMGANESEWAHVKDISYLDIAHRCALDRSVVEAALSDIWHKFAETCLQDPSSVHELLLATGKLVVKENKFFFVPKPIQADTVPGKDCLALDLDFQHTHAHTSHSSQPTSAAAVPTLKMMKAARRMSPMINMTRKTPGYITHTHTHMYIYVYLSILYIDR
jgi:hypothetical protein